MINYDKPSDFYLALGITGLGVGFCFPAWSLQFQSSPAIVSRGKKVSKQEKL